MAGISKISMRKVIATMGIALIALLPGSFAAAQVGEPTVLVLVRHAEKASDGTRDPSLSTEGIERARRLSNVLRDIGLAAVFVSDTRRARETAAPIVASLGVVAEEYPGRDVAALLDRILKDHAGKTVLVIGHSNTVPEMISTLTAGREAVVLRDDEYDAMFIVTLGNRTSPTVLRLRY
ncbi:MAG: SixA phosphatase family protein [Gammaproteobacteria bacterium]